MIRDLVHNIDVGGTLVPCFDVRATNYEGDLYTILSTQTAIQDLNKCGYAWRTTTELQVIERASINKGSRVQVDDVMEAILTAIDGAQPDPASGLVISYRRLDFPGDLHRILDTELIYQKIVRLEYGIR